MTRFSSRRPRLRLDSDSYGQLRQRVLERDGWRCQNCGRPSNLQVHHRNPRARLGGDVEQNLITLCARCHQDVHRRGKASRSPQKPGLCPA
ncbi:MAG: HNH endonuclease [Acidobacteriota bacterium]